MGSKVTKTIGCRMPNGLADSIRAERRGRTMNDVMNEVMAREMKSLDGYPDENGNLIDENNRKPLMNASDISGKVISLRERIKELKATDDTEGFFFLWRQCCKSLCERFTS